MGDRIVNVLPSQILVQLDDTIDQCADALVENASRFTCLEAESLARLLTAAGEPGRAIEFMVEHGQGDDDDGDRHIQISRDLASEIVEGFRFD